MEQDQGGRNMDVVSVLHMNAGEGENSYARNSFVQQKTLLVSKPMKKDAIRKMYESIGRTKDNIVIADLGCSSAPDSLWLLIGDFINQIGLHLRGTKPRPLDFTLYLNDLPGNDFNSIFMSWPGFKEMILQMKEVGHCFMYGVPGSFYGRLFPDKSLHFVHSSYSLHWLSKIPQHIRTSNMGNIYISKTSSACVVDAYYNQFRTDFTIFLRCRSEEIVNGGWMVLTLIGRRSEDRFSKECCYMWDLLAIALNQMVTEGLIEEDKMNSFNIPSYFPSPKEIESIVNDEGSFTIDCMELCEIDWDPHSSTLHPRMHNEVEKIAKEESRHSNDIPSERLPLTNDERLLDIVSSVRVVMEPILIDHFGQVIIDEAFSKYNHLVADRMAKERNFQVNITVSLYKDLKMSRPNTI